jgi:hypothetical protein
VPVIYDVIGDWLGDEAPGVPPSKPRSFGARHTRAEAEALLAEQQQTYVGTKWSFRIEQVETEGLFEIPPRPTPRERFTVEVSQRKLRPGTWPQVSVDVLDGDRVVGKYDRNYEMLRTFEAFRQGERYFALISPNYTATSVMDLQTGEIIAGEEPHTAGFCPVGFYVPDWWDLHENDAERGVLPGSRGWTPDHEWPSRGDFGFVWGCIWGDDSSWKVQYLDLSRIQDGVLGREERFGYTILETGEREGQELWTHPREFIRLSSFEGDPRVEFRSWQNFHVATGEPTDPWE